MSGRLGIGGHTSSFTGWFDQLMAFAFYLPNLVVAEVYLRALCSDSSPANQPVQRVANWTPTSFSDTSHSRAASSASRAGRYTFCSAGSPDNWRNPLGP